MESGKAATNIEFVQVYIHGQTPIQSANSWVKVGVL